MSTVARLGIVMIGGNNLSVSFRVAVDHFCVCGEKIKLAWGFRNEVKDTD